MAKEIFIDAEHPNGCIREIADDVYNEDVVTKPTSEERLEALEAAVLAMIRGGIGGA